MNSYMSKQSVSLKSQLQLKLDAVPLDPLRRSFLSLKNSKPCNTIQCILGLDFILQFSEPD